MRAAGREFIHLLSCHSREQVAKLGRECILDFIVIFVHLLGGRCDGRGQADLPNRRDKGDDLDAVSLSEILLSYSPGGNAA